jgi:hypothetical protein
MTINHATKIRKAPKERLSFHSGKTAVNFAPQRAVSTAVAAKRIAATMSTDF